MPRRLSRRALLSVAAASGVAGSVGWFQTTQERHWLDVRRVRLQPENWRYGRMRIGFLADIHIHNLEDMELAVRAVQALREEKPDVVLLGGDYYTLTHISLNQMLKTVLAEIRDIGVPRAGIFGNHDMMFDGPLRTIEAFKEFEMPLLINGLADVGGLPVYGYDDCLYGTPIRHQEADQAAVHLLHEPDYLDLTGKAPLVLSGHTHGGQICFPGGIPLHLPKGGRRYAHGEYQKGDTTLYVTRGVGTTSMPLRTFCRPEVTVLDVG